MVTDPSVRGYLTPGAPFALVPAGAVILVAVLLLAFAPPVPPKPLPPPGWISPGEYSNGLISASMIAPTPGVTVSPVISNGTYGLYAGLSEIQELGGNGAGLSYANSSGANWTVANDSAPTHLQMAYGASVPVSRPGGNPAPVSAAVSVTFATSAPTAPGSVADSTVTMAIEIDNWPWRPSGSDTMGLEIPFWPSDNRSERLADGPTNTMNCVDVGTHAPREFLRWASQVAAVDASGAQLSMPVAASMSGSSNNSTLFVLFSEGPSVLTQIQYTIEVGIVTPSAPPAIPTNTAIVGISLDIVLGGAVAYGAHAAWSQPPSLREIEE